jgi:hypothetical protein
MINLVEQIRFLAVNDLFSLKAFGGEWLSRSRFFVSKLGKSPKKQDFILLGDHLSSAFRLAGKGDRSQGSVSSAGSTWEALVVWYLNICLVGTNSVCLRGPKFCPKSIQDAMSVCFENTILRSEPDVVLISSNALLEVPAQKSKPIEKADEIISESFDQTGLVNFQCKTNWNDNAQVPMLWNMLYNQARKGAVIPNGFSIGRNGFNLKNLGAFGYSFVTVPTQKKGPAGYKTSGLDVLRVKTMSAGNYWGHPTRSGVCFSIREFFNFFNRNSTIFPNVSDVGRKTAEDAKEEINIKYFNIF